MQKFLLIALAGACGASFRYGSYVIANRYLTGAFPWPTIAVNAFGCLLFGIIYSLSEYRMAISGEMRVVLLVGFIGAFTTFSAFAFENVELMKHSQWTLLALNILVENTAGIVFLLLGIAIGRML